jgi:hypothetical protein
MPTAVVCCESLPQATTMRLADDNGHLLATQPLGSSQLSSITFSIMRRDASQRAFVLWIRTV